MVRWRVRNEVNRLKPVITGPLEQRIEELQKEVEALRLAISIELDHQSARIDGLFTLRDAPRD